MAENVPRRLKRREGKQSDGEKFKKASAEGSLSQGFLRGKKASDESYGFLPESFFEEFVKADVKQDSGRIASEKVRQFREDYKRMPQQDELDEISEEVFLQLKDDYEKKMKGEREKLQKEAAVQREKRKVGMVLEGERRALDRSARKEEKEPDKEFAAEGIEKDMVEENLPEELDFENEKAKEEPGDYSSLSLEEVEKLEPLEEDAKPEEGKEDIETVSADIETDKNKCPSCRNKTEHVIFCPNCGSGFCPHCAAKAEVLGNAVKYSCPACKYSFKASKTHG